MKIDPNGAAFPIPAVLKDSGATEYEAVPGMTIRAYFAGLAMQGSLTNDTSMLLAQERTIMDDRAPEQYFASACVKMADYLIAELNKEPRP